MKKHIFSLFLLLALFPVFLVAQDNRTLETKVADILARIPANDLAYRDRLIDDLFSLGEAGFTELTSLLVPPGTGDDAAVRMAVNSMARVASQPGHEQQRAFLEKALCQAVERRQEPAVRRFLLHQFNLVLTDRSVATVASFLEDSILCEPATQALLSLGSEQAAAAILKALEHQDPTPQPTLIKALGELHYRPAVPQLTKYMGIKDLTVQRITLQALANIGDPASYKTLWQAAEHTDAYEPTMALAAFVTYLDRLGEQNETKLMKKGIKAMLDKCDRPSLLSYRTAALLVFSRHDEEKALSLLLREVKRPDEAYRDALLERAVTLGGSQATGRWIALARRADPALRAGILTMLGRRGDTAALPLVRSSLQEEDSLVRQAALTALVSLQGHDALPALLEHLRTGRDAATTKALLLTVVGADDLPRVAATARESRGAARAACLEVLGARGGSNYLDMILQECTSPDPLVRAAAWNALPGTADPTHLKELMALLLTAQNDRETEAAREAVVRAIRKSTDTKTALADLLKEMDRTDQKERLIAILPALSTTEALNTAEQLFFSSEGSARRAAFEALTRWENPDAAEVLRRIAADKENSYHKKAVLAFVKMIAEAGLPDEQKLLQLRKIMPLCRDSDEKTEVLRAAGRLHIFPALVWTGRYLDDPDAEVRDAAARAVTQIALPTPDGKPGMEGKIVKTLLTQAREQITGEESDYLKARIEDYLSKMPDTEGFVAMFNGKDLSGWKGFVANPVQLAKMDPKELKRKQKEADKEMHQHWTVRDGTIVFNGKGHNLVSVKQYGNFEMWVDWRITKGGDSGIYLRGTPQVQIWDTSRRNVGAQVGSGGLYNNKRNRSTPLVVADNPVGEWNTFHIIMIDSIVTVWLNGILVVDHVPLENYWDRSRPIFPTGPIELQAHGTDLAFRDIYIREIPATGYQVSSEEKAEGFVPLFNGKDLSGWVGNKTDYVVEEGMIAVRPKGGSHGNLYTAKEYKDFILRFDFRLTPGANNGIGIRAPLKGDAAYVGMEIQVLDNTAPIYAHLKPYQYHGSVYGVIPARRGYLKPVGEWNSEEIYVKGSHIRVTLNGHVILDGDIREASKHGTLDHKDHPGLQREQGHIGFLGHGDVVWFRNIRIKEL